MVARQAHSLKIRVRLPAAHKSHNMNDMSKTNAAMLVAVRKGYRVTEDGDVISPLNRKLKLSTKWGDYLAFRVKLYDGTSFSVFVHKLQAYIKFGEKMFEHGVVVRHLNNNKLDNSFDNIAIGTHTDNAMDLPISVRSLRSSSPKHNHDQIINDYKDGMSFSQLMRKYSISSKGTISFIIRKSLLSENNNH